MTLECDTVDLDLAVGSRKVKVGGKWVVKQIPDRSVQDWRGVLNGSFSDVNRNSERDTLTAYYRDCNKVTLTDGLHDGVYCILSLKWPDSSGRPNEHQFVMEIVQDQ